MSWSWSNPSEDEAYEAYSYYRGKYNNAANQKWESERQEQGYRNEKAAAVNQRGELNSQKVHFEKRLEGVEKIIKMMEGRGGWFAADVPSAISKAQKSLAETDTSFRGSIRLSGGGGGASMETAFKPKSVEADAHSASALAAFRAERDNLEQKIAELRSQIANLDAQITSLNSQIRSCNETQSSLQRSMNSYAYDMNHYKKFTYG